MTLNLFEMFAGYGGLSTAIGNGVMAQQAQWALTELYHRAVGVNGLH